MKIEAIKNVNITLLFSGPINHLLISQKDLLDLFKVGDAEKDKHTFIEAPGLKVLILPNQQKEIIFEANRIFVNDKTGKDPKDSRVIDDLQKLLNTSLIEKDKIAAYGFNYNVVATPLKGSFKIEELIGEKITTNIKGIKKAGINTTFERSGVKYVLDLNILQEQGQKFSVHLNAHFDVSKLPDFETLKEKMSEEYKNFEKTIKKI